MRRRIINLLILAGPPLIATLAVWREPALTAWVHKHEAVLPLGLFLLLWSLLHSRLRHMLIVTLCYGVSFLALRDVFLVVGQPLPGVLDYEFVAGARPAALLVVSVLALIAAVVETFRPGTVWARRCYFGAAALYFMGTGVINFCFSHSWQAIMLCITGIAALFGCLLAHRIVASEQEAEEDEEETVSDTTVQQQVEAAHLRALQAKEWHDPSHNSALSDPFASPSPTASAPSPVPDPFRTAH